VSPGGGVSKSKTVYIPLKLNDSGLLSPWKNVPGASVEIVKSIWSPVCKSNPVPGPAEVVISAVLTLLN